MLQQEGTADELQMWPAMPLCMDAISSQGGLGAWREMPWAMSSVPWSCMTRQLALWNRTEDLKA